MRMRRVNLPEAGKSVIHAKRDLRYNTLLLVRLCEWIWRRMIGDWLDEWDLKRRGSDRSFNRHDTCRVASYLNIGIEGDSKKLPRLMPGVGCNKNMGGHKCIIR